ncbi:MAG: adenylosuccinate synthase [Victivallales bacterium]|jgi:adenylosuccinate synthase|nr:adenylosuccinate synthase [Victivallales bacterium]
MPVDILVGTQWGDEGKGKLIDVLTRDVDMVVRFQGGNNAGHTVEIGDEHYVLHLVPSGIFRSNVINVIGNGLVVDVLGLVKEIKEIAERGFSIENIRLSNRAQLIFEYHKRADALKETNAGAKKIGTTKRGIGPAYADKMNRTGIRGIDLTNPVRLEEQFRAEAGKYNRVFAEHNIAPLDIDAEWELVRDAAAFLAGFVCDTVYLVNDAIKSGKKILCEGAQAALLDIDHGTYPFVTSSNTISGGACTGAGIAPQTIRDTWGVIKAYTTRVGEGPFPTELFDDNGELLRKIGHEYGATTGRPRRCGWFDAVAGRYSCMVDGVNKLAVTKLDVLDSFDQIGVCVAYDINGKITKEFPASVEELAAVKPVIEWLPGWKEDISKATTFEQLPQNAKNYLARITELVDSKLSLVSVGPRRDQTFEV